MTDVAVEQLLAGHARTVDRHLASILSQWGREPSRLNESIAYSINAGGKRLRPALVLETFSACGGDLADDDHVVHLAAAAIEMVHTFSLVHDDLPAMDDDELRRGKPTNHKVFGEATAILAGDAMLTMAFNTLAAYRDPRIAAQLMLELAGATEAMIAGQSLDIEGEKVSLTLEQLQRVHERKTGALITAACRMGGICGGATDDQLASLGAYGKHLGTAFQIVDDILDETATPQELGKATRKDAGSGKNTYPRLLGLDGSRQAAAEHVHSALGALDEFAASAGGLRALARFVQSRGH